MQPAAKPERQRVAERGGIAGPVEHAPADLRASVEPLAEQGAEQSGEGRGELGAIECLLGESSADGLFPGHQALSAAPRAAAAATIRAEIAFRSSSVKLFSAG